MENSSKYLKEACVDSLAQAVKAEAQGADRIELCSRLDLDGLTPSMDLIAAAKSNLSIPTRVMIRPRAGSFVFSNEEINQMLDAINYCNSLEMEGVVIGVLKSNNNINLEVTKKLAKEAGRMKVTFHKAFDLTPNPHVAFQELADLKLIDAVLTSGQQSTAVEGVDLLKKLIQAGPEYPSVIVAGKVNQKNIESLHLMLDAKYFHGKKIVGDL